MIRHDAKNKLSVAILAVIFGLAVATELRAQPRYAGDWSGGFGQGWLELGTRFGSNEFAISCDIGYSLDHGGTGIGVAIGGTALPPDSDVILEVDGAAIVMPTDEAGRIAIGDCVECAGKFRELWHLLRQGRELQVIAADGRRAWFSLRGSSQVMPPEPCPTRIAAAGTEADAAPPSARRPVRSDCIALRLDWRGQTELEGMARSDQGVCYALETPPGQIAQLEVLEGSNIAITVPGIADARQRLEFDAEGGPYEVNVIQMQRADRAARYRLRVAMREGSLPRGGVPESLERDTSRDSLAEEFARARPETDEASPAAPEAAGEPAPAPEAETAEPPAAIREEEEEAAAPTPAAPAETVVAAPAPADDGDDGRWKAAGERLRTDILARARDFCRAVHDTDGSLLPDAVKSLPGPQGDAPDLAVSYRAIQCAGVEDAPLKLGGFCGLTMEGMKCRVEVYSFKGGDYVEARSYLE